MAKREFLMLSHKYKDGKDIKGWYLSEKLDGMRAFWDGGVTEGMKAAEVPWANTEKDHIRVEEPVSTGLWSRGGKVVHAPSWWTALLPRFPVDGELYMGRKKFQEVMKVVKDFKAGPEWEDVKFCWFGFPTWRAFLKPGPIFNRTLGVLNLDSTDGPWSTWAQCMGDIDRHRYDNEVVGLVDQTVYESEDVLWARMDEVVKEGGEGLMAVNPYTLWEPCRSHNLLKIKTFEDDEDTIIGYTWGKETNRGSKFAGMIGNVIMQGGWELCGFNDEERQVDRPHAWDPGKPIPSDVLPLLLKMQRGQKLRYKYRELTDDGLPKEARYWR